MVSKELGAPIGLMLMALVAGAVASGCAQQSELPNATASQTDQATSKPQVTDRGEAGDKAEPPKSDVCLLPQLTPPVSMNASAISGEGAQRKAEIVVTNTGSRPITSMVVRVYFLEEDGTVAEDVPHSRGGFSGRNNACCSGESETIEITSFFMTEKTARVFGVMTSLEFEDGSAWPSWNGDGPTQTGEGSVAATMLGTIGPRHLARPVVALLNHDSRPVKGVAYSFDFVDADGNVLDTDQYGFSGSEPIMESGKGCAVAGGMRPPGGTASARITLTRVDFADEVDPQRSGG